MGVVCALAYIMYSAPTSPVGADASRARRLGAFELCYELGRGGMASVYMAREASDGRLVAVKVMHPHLSADPGYVEMFVDEARLASCIDHPNVCSVECHGAQDDKHYMVQELLSGETFWALIRRQARAKEIRTAGWVGLSTRIVADTLEGLHAVHEAVDQDGRHLEAVHRDVSPHNIVVEYDGRVRVVDLGIAHATEREQHTQTGVLKGKMSYVAPEQIFNRHVDRRVDVWAAGVTLWEALTGRFLFKCKGTLPTLRAVQRREVVPPSEVNPLVPPAVDAIVLAALSRERDARPPTARAMAEALREAVAGLSEPWNEDARADWMASVFGPERDYHDHLRRMARQGDSSPPDALPPLDAVATQLTTMAEILPFEDITDVDFVEDLETDPEEEEEEIEPTRIIDHRPLLFAMVAVCLVALVGTSALGLFAALDDDPPAAKRVLGKALLVDDGGP